MITYFIIKMHCKRRVLIHNLQVAARPHVLRTHGALEDPAALPQRPHRALSNTLCKRQAAAFVLNMFKINAAVWRSRRFTSVFM